MAPSERPPDGDVVYRVLAHSRRRHVLDILSGSDSRVRLADLAADIASRERDESDEADEEEYVERVQISLYHSHIPKLEEIGVVDFDAADKTVSSTTDR